MTDEKCVYAQRSTIVEAELRLKQLLCITEQELLELKSTHVSIPRAAALLRQNERLYKRAILTSDRNLAAEAKHTFEITNQMCGDSAHVVNLDPTVLNDAKDFIFSALCRVSGNSGDSKQCDLDMSILLQNWRYGPGASKGTTKTHFVEKISIKNPTCTLRASPYADLLRKLNPHLFSFDGEKSCEFTIVKGSSISTVPKNADTERTIATEPLMNMALQLAAGTYIEEALRCVGLDIKVQADKNNNLACLGSIDDGIATIDLKSASDLISIDLIRLLWPPSWFKFLSDIRSEFTSIDGRWVELNMMSTMGNGFTFPMMTLTLLALVYATQSYRQSKRLFIDFDDTAVFGDDIIVPSDDYDALVSTLADAGLVVNLAKSYSEGPFRESCGGDYWLGYNITPFYIETLYNDPEVYVAINKIHDWSSRTGMYLPKTISYLLQLIRIPYLVPYWSNPTEGIRHGQVSPRYNRWVPKRYRSSVTSDSLGPFLGLLVAIGGYATGELDSRFCFSRRLPNNRAVKWKLEKVRFPKGRTDAFDHGIRDVVTDAAIDFQFLEVFSTLN